MQATNSSGLLDAYTYDGTKFKKVNVLMPISPLLFLDNSKGDIVTPSLIRRAPSTVRCVAWGFLLMMIPTARAQAVPALMESMTYVIVGRYSPSDGSNHGFKAVPVKTSLPLRTLSLIREARFVELVEEIKSPASTRMRAFLFDRRLPGNPHARTDCLFRSCDVTASFFRRLSIPCARHQPLSR